VPRAFGPAEHYELALGPFAAFDEAETLVVELRDFRVKFTAAGHLTFNAHCIRLRRVKLSWEGRLKKPRAQRCAKCNPPVLYGSKWGQSQPPQ
jgi:hypothetical protein